MTSDPNAVYAHSLPGRPLSEWELLDDHARRVAHLARSFAAEFGAGDWGELLGRWHDLGKRSDEFQRYIRATGDPDAGEDEGNPAGRVDHSTFGAQHAARVVGKHFGQLLAYCIAGHHGSLPDAFSDDERTRASTLHGRLAKATSSVRLLSEDGAAPKLQLPFVPTREGAGFQMAFFTRMLFSALIDADRTATEEFCDSVKAAERKHMDSGIDDLRLAIKSFLHGKQLAAARTPVNRVRADVLAECYAASCLERGFFSLNVPTGGGKTYASLAFALEHAHKYNLHRVIVAIPFTSIIEQTADAYRKALGPVAEGGLIEHHSDIIPERDTRPNKLAAENWDAPLVVTTNVQLYESLFAARGTPCRKLHRLARSVIVLDEAQTIPVDLIEPTLLALKELVTHYGCSIVFCTATQPALERREEDFRIGFENVRPIVGNASALFDALRRVEVRWIGRVDDEALGDRLANEPSVLCVVNTRAHAASLYDALVSRRQGEGCYHLSTFMCAQHRRAVLADVRQRLRDGKSCHLISTQLIEAGVDVDFPVVYRAAAGFDSIAQAAGRCNREGTLEQNGRAALGRVYVFDAESLPPPGVLRAAAQCGRELVPRYSDPIAPEAVEAFFRLFYWTQEHRWDGCEVMPPLSDDFMHPAVQLKFRTAASRYRIIRDEQTQVLVPYDGDARALRDHFLRSSEVDFGLMRTAQRYIVGVRDGLLKVLQDNGVVIEHESGLWLLVNDDAYSDKKGISPQAVGIDPQLLNL